MKKINAENLREEESRDRRLTGTACNFGGMSATNVHICRRVSSVATATLSQARRRHVCGICACNGEQKRVFETDEPLLFYMDIVSRL